MLKRCGFEVCPTWAASIWNGAGHRRPDAELQRLVSRPPTSFFLLTPRGTCVPPGAMSSFHPEPVRLRMSLRMPSSARGEARAFHRKGVLHGQHLPTPPASSFLDRVTPVISALFGAFASMRAIPAAGRLIARLAEINDPQWSDVLDGLLALAAQFDLPAPDDAEGGIATVTPNCRCLPYRPDRSAFGADQNQDLANLIQSTTRLRAAQTSTRVFLIATCFDDGHHLVAIQLEGCWRCSRLAFRVRRSWLLHQPRADGIERIHACAATRRGIAHRQSWLATLRRRANRIANEMLALLAASPTTRFAHACAEPLPTACSRPTPSLTG